MSKKGSLAFIIGIYLSIGILPISITIFESFFINGSFTLELYREIFATSKYVALFQDSFLLAFLVTSLTLLVGITLGILFEKTNLPFKKTLLALFIIPLLLPPYMIALAWSHFFGEWFFGFFGVVFVEFSIYLPIVILATFVLLKGVNSKLEESARMFSSWDRVLSSITIPLILPSIFLIATLVFLLSFGNYSVANFLRFNTFVLDSFVEFSAFYNYNNSFALSFILIIFIVGLLLIERFYMSNKEYVSPIKNFTFDNTTLIDLKSYKMALFLLVSSLAFIIVIVPIFLLIYESGGLQNYIEAFMIAKMSILRSLSYAFFGASIISFFGFFLAYTIKNSVFKFAYLLDITSIVLFAIPSTILGVALVQFFNHEWSSFIYVSPLIIIIGYIVKYSAISSRIFIANLRQIPPSMEESAKVLGVSWSERIIYIVLPLSKGGFLLSWFVSFVFLLRDTDITMLLYSAGYDSLAIKIFTLMANSPSELISALCVIMIAIILLPIGFLYLLKGVSR